jgi:cell division protein FtsA
MAGVEIDSVHLALSGRTSRVQQPRRDRGGRQEPRDHARGRRRAIDAAKAVSLPTGREILHVLPQDFVVDEQDGIGAPVGMTGARLEVNVHIVTGSQSSTQNIVACVNRAASTVAETIVEQLAASESVPDRGREGARRRAGRHRRRHRPTSRSTSAAACGTRR